MFHVKPMAFEVPITAPIISHSLGPKGVWFHNKSKQATDNTENVG